VEAELQGWSAQAGAWVPGHAAFNVQLRDGGDLVGLRLRGHLPQYHPRLAVAQALTRCSAPRPAARSCERRSVFPSKAMTSPGITERIASAQARKHASKACGAGTENTRPKVRKLGLADVHIPDPQSAAMERPFVSDRSRSLAELLQQRV
jgi:hypothetical protein